MKNITNVNQLIYTVKNMDNSPGNHTSKRTYNLRLPGVFRTISLDGSGCRYKLPCSKSERFLDPGPDKKFG